MELQGDISARRSVRQSRWVAVVAILLGVMYASVELAAVGWDPAGVLAVGEADEVRVEYAEDLFERQIPLAPMLGHDGRFFIIQAMDPLLLSPDEHARYLDRPTYRAQRMLYPLLAGVAAPFGPDGVAWAMLVVNVLAFGAGTWATARLAGSYELSPWWGLVFALNPGVRFELDIEGAGVIALAGLMFGLWLIRSRRLGLAIVALTVAVLSREVMLLAVGGIALARGVGDLRDRIALVSVPTVAVAVWWLYVQIRLGDLPGGAPVEEIGWPFAGFAGAFELWIHEPGIDLMLGTVYLALAAIAVARAIRLRGLLEMPMVGFAVLSVLLTRQVWFRHFDISRALAPIPTLLLLSLAVSLFAPRQAAVSEPEEISSLSDG